MSGNVKDFILSEVTGSVEFVLTCDAVEILRENYEPIAGRVEIPVKLVIDELLKISIPDFDSVIYEQTRAVNRYTNYNFYSRERRIFCVGINPRFL